MDSDPEQLQKEIIIERNSQDADNVESIIISVPVPLVVDNVSQDALNHNLETEQLNIVKLDKNQNPSTEELNVNNQEKETLIQASEVVSAYTNFDKENEETTEDKIIVKGDPIPLIEGEKNKGEPSTSKSNFPVEVKTIYFTSI